ncbi:MAG TPA: hypothetical protein VJ772_00095 [Nitrososphaeraceae archaeon]|nr:hypothetical protein [Nitrososphaeraceae archaeon]
MILNTAWNDLIKKKASGIDCDLGQVQQVRAEFIVIEKGIINKKKYYIPKNLIAGFDGHTLFFRILKAESKRYRQDDKKLQKVTKKIN